MTSHLKKGRGFGKGRSPTKFSFTYEDYAEMLGCSVESVRKHAQRGNFDPCDLVSVMEFVNDRLRSEPPLVEGGGKTKGS